MQVLLAVLQVITFKICAKLLAFNFFNARQRRKRKQRDVKAHLSNC